MRLFASAYSVGNKESHPITSNRKQAYLKGHHLQIVTGLKNLYSEKPYLYCSTSFDSFRSILSRT